jgi:hypothetical protein
MAYNTLTTLQPGEPRGPRVLSPAALAVALVFTLGYPSFLGTVMGGVAVFWLGDWFWLKLGTTLGILLGCGLSGQTLIGSALLWKVTAPQPELQPQGVTIEYRTTRPAENIRIVPLTTYPVMVDNCPARDLAWFCLGLSRGIPHTQRNWTGKTAPSGQLVDADYWKSLCKPLRRAGLIEGVGPRKAGHKTLPRCLLRSV